MPTFDDIDAPEQLLAPLGSYWSRRYPDPDGLQALLSALGVLLRRTGDDVAEMPAFLSRTALPAGQRKKIALLYFDDATAEAVADAYPGGYDPAQSRTYRLDDSFLHVEILLDQPLLPQTIYLRGVDFIDDNTAHTLTSLENISGNRIGLDVRYDRGWVGERLGEILGYRLGDSEAYRDALNAVLDGPGVESLGAFLEALSDTPRVAADGEVVEEVYDDGRFQLVITDQHVYRLPRGITLLVDPGDTLTAGQVLCKAWELLSPPHRTIPADLSEIVLPGNWLDPSLGGPLTFVNDDKTLSLSTVSGYTKLTWSMPDDPGDVSDFFTLLHTRGVAAGACLANYLDLRPAGQTTQPGADELPSTINPLEILLQTVFAGNVHILRLRPTLFGEKALSTAVLDLLPRLLPPETGLLVVTE